MLTSAVQATTPRDLAFAGSLSRAAVSEAI
jgi:hypothetical protein